MVSKWEYNTICEYNLFFILCEYNLYSPSTLLSTLWIVIHWKCSRWYSKKSCFHSGVEYTSIFLLFGKAQWWILCFWWFWCRQPRKAGDIFNSNKMIKSFQISKIVGCELKRIGDLPNPFYLGTCGTFVFDGDERVMFCFPDSGKNTCFR